MWKGPVPRSDDGQRGPAAALGHDVAPRPGGVADVQAGPVVVRPGHEELGHGAGRCPAAGPAASLARSGDPERPGGVGARAGDRRQSRDGPGGQFSSVAGARCRTQVAVQDGLRPSPRAPTRS